MIRTIRALRNLSAISRVFNRMLFSRPNPSGGKGKRTISYSRVVDLSHEIAEDIPLWPGDPPVEFKTVADRTTHGYYLRRFCMGEHGATHMNAPNSFHAGGPGIEAYPAERLVAQAIVIDIHDQAGASPDYALSVEDVAAWEAQHGRIPPGTVVLLYTGWEKRWHDPDAYFGRDASGGLHFPGFGSRATRTLIEERCVAGVGTDAPGADPGWDRGYGTNVQVLANAGIVLESLTNLEYLPPTGTTLVIGMLRLRGGSGSPAAVLAFVP